MQTMQFDRFSPKQRTAMCWWSQRRYSGYDAIICDGAVRSGKTFSMGEANEKRYYMECRKK